MRVNARFDDEAEKQITYLTQATGQSVSHVVREAVALYYRQTLDRQQRPRRLLAAIGSADSGKSDGATDYKRIVAEAIDAKYPRPAR